MAGYTPVFNSVFTGTLCGQYPDTAAWLFLLALADKHGVVDMTPAYISNVTGMPQEDLIACIERFMQPDPYSRTTDHDGRRLLPLDPARPWGWKIVNHAKYKEKARLQAREAQRVNTGENASRMKNRRATPDDPRRPPMTTADPPSDTDTDTDNSPSESVGGTRPRRGHRWGDAPDGVDPAAWIEFTDYKGGTPVAATVTKLANKLAKATPAAQRAAVEDAISNGWKGVFPEKHDEARRNGSGRGRETTREFAERMARIAEGHPG